MARLCLQDPINRDRQGESFDRARGFPTQREGLPEISNSLRTHQYVTLQFLRQVLNSGGQVDGIPYESVGQPVLAAGIPGQNNPGMDANPVFER